MKPPRIFVVSEEILPVIAIAKDSGKRPSEICGIIDEYTAYCFDTACLYIKQQIADGKKPRFRKKQNLQMQKHYSNFADYISDLKQSANITNLPK